MVVRLFVHVLDCRPGCSNTKQNFTKQSVPKTELVIFDSFHSTLYPVCILSTLQKYVVKHKSAKLFMTYAVGKLEAALNISHLILSTSSQRVS